MDDDEITVDDERVQRRAELLPEESVVGSEDPEAQAAAILEDSEARTASRAAPDAPVEHRSSQDVTPPTT